MFVFKFMVLFSLTAGSYCMSLECHDTILVECTDGPILESMKMETIEDLRKFCSLVISNARCKERVLEKCVQENDERNDLDKSKNEIALEKAEKVARFYESACKEDSEIFQDIATDVKCYFEILDNKERDVCLYAHNHKDEISSLFEENFTCVAENWFYYCLRAQMAVTCGNRLGNTFGMVMRETGSPLSPKCMPTLRNFLYLENAFKLGFCQGKYEEEAVLSGIMEAVNKQAENKLSVADDSY